ncbi:MAG: hypothetical protein A2Y17_03665 [Clostridiales bacterium GWF2_38_85]|nr:MAG: hypothetical protein A2Y17_03665 [Clostridiales bacterium GWF2_38_85]HBL85306.1 hypothetical protein [Clostridiales bacterium]
MNIAIFLEAYYPYVNGVVTHVSMLKESLEKNGHNVLIITADPKVKRHKLIDGVLYCPAIALKRIYGYGLSLPRSRKRLEILRAFKSDVIHVHHEFTISYFGVKSAIRMNLPIVYTLHTMYNDYIHYVIKHKNVLPAAKKLFYSYIRYIAKNADMVISPSHKAIGFIRECGLKDKQVEIIPNSIDIYCFNKKRFTADDINIKRKELGVGDNDFTGIFAGRLAIEKSIDYIINCWVKFFVNKPEYKLIIIGEGPQKQELKAFVKKYNLDRNIIFTGRLDHNDMPLMYAVCDYYISASVTEMMSISMLEALATGIPAVLRLDKENSSQIVDGKTGFFFETPEEMVSIIDKLSIKTSEQREEAYNTIRENMTSLSSDRCIDFMLNVYNKAIENHKYKKHESE